MISQVASLLLCNLGIFTSQEQCMQHLFCFVLLFQICDVAEVVIKRHLYITTSATLKSSLKLLQCHGRKWASTQNRHQVSFSVRVN
jgi:hypothetical membrane protein